MADPEQTGPNSNSARQTNSGNQPDLSLLAQAKSPQKNQPNANPVGRAPAISLTASKALIDGFVAANPLARELLSTDGFKTINDLKTAGLVSVNIARMSISTDAKEKRSAQPNRLAIMSTFNRLIGNHSAPELVRMYGQNDTAATIGYFALELTNLAIENYNARSRPTRDSMLSTSTALYNVFREASNLAQLSIQNFPANSNVYAEAHIALLTSADRSLEIADSLRMKLSKSDSSVVDSLTLLASANLAPFRQANVSLFPLSVNSGTILFKDNVSMTAGMRNILSSIIGTQTANNLLAGQAAIDLGGVSIPAAQLATFFNSQRASNKALTADEKKLLTILEKRKMLEGGAVQPYRAGTKEEYIAFATPATFVHESQHRNFHNNPDIAVWTANRMKSLPISQRSDVVERIIPRSISLQRASNPFVLKAYLSDDKLLDQFIRASEDLKIPARVAAANRTLSGDNMLVLMTLLTEYYAYGSDLSQSRLSPLAPGQNP